MFARAKLRSMAAEVLPGPQGTAPEGETPLTRLPRRTGGDLYRLRKLRHSRWQLMELVRHAERVADEESQHSAFKALPSGWHRIPFIHPGSSPVVPPAHSTAVRPKCITKHHVGAHTRLA